MNIEISLINSILTNKHIIPVIKKLTLDHFLTPTAQRIYEFLSSYFKQYKTIPTIEIIKEKFPDFEYQVETADVNYWVDRVLQKKCETDLTEAILETTNILKEKGGFEALELIQKKILRIQKITRQQEDIDITKNAEERINNYIEKAAISGLSGIPCGIQKIDNLTSGFQNGELISIIGLPGVGKSFLATFFAKSAWEVGFKVLFITLEMGIVQVWERFDSLVCRLNHSHLKRGRLTQEEFNIYKEYCDKLKPNKVPFIVSKPTRCTQSIILAKIDEHKPDICLIDYSSLIIDERGGKEWQAVANIVRDLKGFAGDEKINIPIIVLNQVHRGFERSREELPKLENIAHSYTVAADSDIVIACHATDTMKEDNEMLIGIQKHRDGRNIQLRLRWNLDAGDISELPDIKNG